jgi:hypothetical protein
MIRRGAWICAALLLLSGCVTDKVGPDYAATPQRIGPPPTGRSRIVLLAAQKKGLLFQGTVCDVKLCGRG